MPARAKIQASDGVPRNCEAPSAPPAPPQSLLRAPGPAVAISYLHTFLRHGGGGAGSREGPHCALGAPYPGAPVGPAAAQGRGRGLRMAPPFLLGPLFRFRLRGLSGWTGRSGSALAPPLLLRPRPRRVPGVCTLQRSARTSGGGGGAASAVGHMSPRCAGSASSRPRGGGAASEGRLGSPCPPSVRAPLLDHPLHSSLRNQELIRT